MKLPFSDNHISYAAQDRVKKILSPLSKLANITYFNYSITYPDYTHFTLHCNKDYYESWFLNHFPLWECHFKSGWYLWNDIRSEGKNELADNLGISNGIIYINHKEDRTEAFSFATSPENTKIVNFYLNNLNLLKRFKNHFEEEAAEFINVANSQLIRIPQNMTKDIHFISNNSMFHENEMLTNEQFETSPFNELSNRELECYSLLIRGYTLSYISNKLGIAIPTVSNYITRIKQKLKCDKKEEMLHLAEKNNVVEFFL